MWTGLHGWKDTPGGWRAVYVTIVGRISLAKKLNFVSAVTFI